MTHTHILVIPILQFLSLCLIRSIGSRPPLAGCRVSVFLLYQRSLKGSLYAFVSIVQVRVKSICPMNATSE